MGGAGGARMQRCARGQKVGAEPVDANLGLQWHSRGVQRNARGAMKRFGRRGHHTKSSEFGSVNPPPRLQRKRRQDIPTLILSSSPSYPATCLPDCRLLLLWCLGCRSWCLLGSLLGGSCTVGGRSGGGALCQVCTCSSGSTCSKEGVTVRRWRHQPGLPMQRQQIRKEQN